MLTFQKSAHCLEAGTSIFSCKNGTEDEKLSKGRIFWSHS